MRLSLDVIRARKGDCLILHYGTKQDPRLLMIDGGPSDVYVPHLKPRLMQIRKGRRLGDQEPLPVDALMVSHVDDDHIKGILDLTREFRGMTGARPLRVRSLWHNSFDDMLGTTPGELKTEAGFGAAAVAGEVDVEDVEELDTAKVLASIPQGRTLRDDAAFLKWKPNDKFAGKLILATSKTKALKFDGGLALTVVGPMQPELTALQEAHDKWLKEQKKKKEKDPQAALAAFVDKSIPNLSSIVMLVEADGKRMLLTGDARGDKILKGLQLVGLLAPGDESTMHVDLLKVPHHGSANNLETSFFRRITADHYVFSGNGEHGNPERESLEMLSEARGNDDYTIHLTYPIDEIDEGRKEDWEKEQAKEKSKKKKKPAQKVRPNWSPAKHSLAVFFDQHPGLENQVRIVPESKPHVIDLLDPLGF